MENPEWIISNDEVGIFMFVRFYNGELHFYIDQGDGNTTSVVLDREMIGSLHEFIEFYKRVQECPPLKEVGFTLIIHNVKRITISIFTERLCYALGGMSGSLVGLYLATLI